MQRVSLPFLQAGMLVAKGVYNSEGRLLLSAGTILAEGTIPKLENLGVGSVYVCNPLFSDLEVPELINIDTRVRTIQGLQSVVRRFQRTGELNLEPLKGAARQLVVEIVRNREAMIHLVDLRTYDDYLIAHSVNVCILSLLTAVNMDYSEDKLLDLALGCLLHDLGMTAVPAEILAKVGSLTPRESRIVQEHAEAGFNYIRKLRDISVLAAHIAFQHHERFDGKGYPRQMIGTDIHEYGRIAAVADIFDALISDRPYRKGMLPHEAYETLMTLGGTFVDPEIVNIFLAHVAIYPMGSVVQLASNEIGLVIKVLPKLQSRPVIRLLTDTSGQLLEQPREIDLTEHLTLFITRVLKESEIFDLLKPAEPAT
ncbi:MAG: HD-GYP domain-containing protein [Sporomusaceae bacterium]|nr:HD-GYP domain-containing protein [Sporomusaceae bacterium]